ncbi:MAG: hypothetical protein A2Y10_12685 [Planctomycetes bacterium GWF2_41_51]|nr:MAG: hypothetical protein A2Y10_12685 [Planctomycetes bacterium GWF2_41_51]HBG28617.1 hypothetical protein [Phycisphaerales bacterium]
MTFIQTIGLSLIGTTILSPIIVFLLREWISTRIKNSIEHEYKVKQEHLKAELEGKLEGLRSGYKKFLDENQIKFSRLHNDQAEVIKTLYQYLVQMERAALNKMSDFWNKISADEKQKNNWSEINRKQMSMAYLNFKNYYEENKILLPEKICQNIEQLMGLAAKASLKYELGAEGIIVGTGDNSIDIMKEDALRTMTIEFKPLRKELENCFRIIRGIEKV